MRKILIGLGMITFVGALAVGATGAFFSDSETSTGNTFAAGEIDLQIDNTSYATDYTIPGFVDPTGALALSSATSWALADLTNELFFNFTDVKPGDIGEDTISLHVNNNDSYACMDVTLTATPENTVTEPEGDLQDDGPDGELQNELNFAWWGDDGDNVYEVGETIFAEGSAATLFAANNGTWALADSDNNVWGEEVLPGDSTRYIAKYWCYGEITASPVVAGAEEGRSPLTVGTGFVCDGSEATNIGQTDGISVDVSFDAVQSRNNENFLCNPEVTPTPPPQETATVTVDKIVTFSNQQIAGVDVTDFTLTIDGPGAPQVVADEAATAGLPIGTYSISEVYSGDPANVTFNASFSGGCSEVGDTGVGTMNVVAGVNPTCTITNSVSLLPN